MSDLDLQHSINRCAELALKHRCTYSCNLSEASMDTVFATGQVPPGAWDRLAGLARKHGFRLMRSHFPRNWGGPGCDGVTIPHNENPDECRALGVRPGDIHIQAGLHPATEFFVACHEMTHALLQHREDPKASKKRSYRRTDSGKTEFFDEEIQAHLAAIAVSRAVGLKIRRSALCYVSEKFHHFMQTAGDKEKYGALLAARQMAAVL